MAECLSFVWMFDKRHWIAGQSVQNALTTNLSAWMVIPNTMINTGGTVCNTIGTSYNAFRYQTVGRCCPSSVHPCLSQATQILTLRYAIVPDHFLNIVSAFVTSMWSILLLPHCSRMKGWTCIRAVVETIQGPRPCLKYAVNVNSIVCSCFQWVFHFAGESCSKPVGLHCDRKFQ